MDTGPTVTVTYNDGLSPDRFTNVIDVETQGGFLIIVNDDGAAIIPAHRVHLATAVAIEVEK